MRRHLLVAAVGASLVLGSRSIDAQNLLANAAFDQDLAGWAVRSYDPQWSSADASGSLRSGSVRAFVPGASPPEGSLTLSQCVPVAGSASYDLSLKTQIPEPDVTVGHFQFFAASDCKGSTLTSGSIYLYTADWRPSSWLTVHQLVAAPAGAHSVSVDLYANTRSDGGPSTAFFDDVYFGPPAPTSCGTGAKTLCIDRDPGDARFQVRMTYATVQSGGLAGEGNAIPLSSLGVDRGGLFWFFGADNPEALVKVLDACSINGYFWVFISAGTNVGVNVLIGDTVTGAVVLFHNPDLGAFPPIQNIYAIPCD